MKPEDPTITFRDFIFSFLIWLFLVCIFGALGIFLLNWPGHRDISKSGVMTMGNVTAKERHRVIRYSYQVDRQVYSGIGDAGQGNPEFEQLKTGSAVKIFYDPKNPGKSVLGDPTEESNSRTRGVMILALGGSMLCLYGFYVNDWLPISKHDRI